MNQLARIILSRPAQLLGGILVLTFLLSGSSHVGVASAQAERPNIVFILTDDMTKRDLIYMPQIRALIGTQGTTFKNAFVTFSLCCPSRATILRGQYAHNHRILGNTDPYGGAEKFRRYRLDKSTAATWLGDAGYNTMFAGKYLNQYYGNYIPPGWDDWFAKSGSYTSKQYNDNGTLVPGSSDDAKVLRQRATSYIGRAPADTPFFMYLATHAPHGPHEVAPEDETAYPDAHAPRGPSFNERDVSDKPRWVRRHERLTRPEIEKIDRTHRDRARSLLQVDDLVAGVVDALRRRGELENTYVFFTSDNGYKEGAHRLQGKWTAYEEDIRIPLLVRGPGVPPGRTISHTVLNNDLAPTFADLAAASTPAFVDGRSIKPLLGTTLPERWRHTFLVENFYSESPDGFPAPVPPYKGVRTANYSYVEYQSGATELYSIRADPYQLDSIHETRNRSLLGVLDRRLSALVDCAGEECRAAEGG